MNVIKANLKMETRINKFYKDDLGYPPLFKEDEIEKAEKILSQLEGLSISSASELLDKCKVALEQVPLSNIL